MQQEDESADSFITSLYALSTFCNYADLREEVIRDRIVIGIDLDMDFLNLKKNIGGKETMRARDLFYRLWIPDLFLKRVEKNEKNEIRYPIYTFEMKAVVKTVVPTVMKNFVSEIILTSHLVASFYEDM